jgi:hypothetical protein
MTHTATSTILAFMVVTLFVAAGVTEGTFEIRREQPAIPWLDWVVGEIEICHQQRPTLLVSLSK